MQLCDDNSPPCLSPGDVSQINYLSRQMTGIYNSRRPPIDSGSYPGQSTISQDDIRHRAYELYVQRGAISGYEVENWLRAKRELLGT